VVVAMLALTLGTSCSDTDPSADMTADMGRDSGVEMAVPDLPMPDAPMPDKLLPDAPPPDAPPPDAPIPDLPLPDAPVPDLPPLDQHLLVPDCVCTPDIPTPDLTPPDLPIPDLPPPDLPIPDLPIPDLPFPDLPPPDTGVTCCQGLPTFTVDAKNNVACNSLSLAVNLGTLQPGTYRVYYKSGTARTGAGYDWNRSWPSRTPSCSQALTPGSWQMEWTHGVLPGFSLTGWSTIAKALAAVKCTHKDYVVSKATTTRAWYLDNWASDNQGSVTYCYAKIK